MRAMIPVVALFRAHFKSKISKSNKSKIFKSKVFKSTIAELTIPALVIAAMAIAGSMASGCLQVAPQPPVPPTTMSSWGPMGGFSMSSGAPCTGRATLSDGTASVSDACFTGADNIVMCTDITAANPLRCTPAAGSLAISGGIGDTISYARIR